MDPKIYHYFFKFFKEILRITKNNHFLIPSRRSNKFYFDLLQFSLHTPLDGFFFEKIKKE